MAQERMIVLSEAVGLLRFLFVEDVEIEPAAAEKQLSGPEAAEVLDAATAALAELDGWSTPAIEEALKTALVEGLGRKPRQAFGPVRVAISGRTVSPPLYESIELLGRERTLARLRAARALAARRPPRPAMTSAPGVGGRRRALLRSAPDPASRPGSLGARTMGTRALAARAVAGPAGGHRARQPWPGPGSRRPRSRRLAAAPWARSVAAAPGAAPWSRRLGPPPGGTSRPRTRPAGCPRARRRTTSRSRTCSPCAPGHGAGGVRYWAC